MLSITAGASGRSPLTPHRGRTRTVFQRSLLFRPPSSVSAVETSANFPGRNDELYGAHIQFVGDSNCSAAPHVHWVAQQVYQRRPDLWVEHRDPTDSYASVLSAGIGRHTDISQVVRILNHAKDRWAEQDAGKSRQRASSCAMCCTFPERSTTYCPSAGDGIGRATEPHVAGACSGDAGGCWPAQSAIALQP